MQENNLKNINLDDIPKFDQRKNFLEPNKYLEYFEKIADLKNWQNQERAIKLISKVEGTLQNELIEQFKNGWNEVKKKFLSTRIESRDYIGNLEKKFSYEYNLERFLIEKRIAAKQLAQKSSDELFVDAVRRSLPINYQWITSKEDIEKVLPLKLKDDKKIYINAEKVEDQNAKKKNFKKLRYDLLKRAYKLSVNCGCQIALICFDSDYKLTQYASENMDKILTMYIDYEDKCFDYFTNEEVKNAIIRSKIKKENADKPDLELKDKLKDELKSESILDKFNELVTEKEQEINKSNDLAVKNNKLNNLESNSSSNKDNLINLSEQEIKKFHEFLDLFQISELDLNYQQLNQEDIINLKKYFSSPNEFPKIQLVKQYYDLIVEYQVKDLKYFLSFFNHFLTYYSLLTKNDSSNNLLGCIEDPANDIKIDKSSNESIKKLDENFFETLNEKPTDKIPESTDKISQSTEQFRKIQQINETGQELEQNKLINQVEEMVSIQKKVSLNNLSEISEDTISMDSIELIEENEILELTENCESLNLNENFIENSSFESDDDDE